MSNHRECYFTEEGAYGNTEDLTIIDTTNWTAKDWERIENASDGERHDIALIINDFRSGELS
jgi:hypothetical protein